MEKVKRQRHLKWKWGREIEGIPDLFREVSEEDIYQGQREK